MNVRESMISTAHVIDKVRYLSQEEGLSDTEIADILSCSRKTVVEIRGHNDIPKSNLENRCDKQLICFKCKKIYVVKRSAKLGEEVCPICNPKVITPVELD